MPSYKVTNFPKLITSINGQIPDEFGNVNIEVYSGGGGSSTGYSFTEEYFTLSGLQQITLRHSPYLAVPITLTVNGIIYPKSSYVLSGSTLHFPLADVAQGDYVRVLYAYTDEAGFAYPFSEEYFTYSGNILLQRAPALAVPLTVSVNGIIISSTEYGVSSRNISISGGVVQLGDNVRVVYAYGGI